jgi:hypothetical protein
MRKHIALAGILTGVLAMLATEAANAIPAFARKYDMDCSNCHLAFPQLNATGRRFKEAGYRFQAEEEEAKTVSDFLQLDEHVPLSAILVGRPYDKQSGGQSSIRAIHEVELIAGGIIGRQWSGWFELEAEDETDFDPEVGNAIATYTHNEALNFQLAWAPVFWSDPYGLLGDHFRMTRGHVGAIDTSFGGADGGGRLRDNRQSVGVYGRLAEKFFYSANVSGVAGDSEGENPGNFSGRLAVDVLENVMVGGFGFTGEDGSTNLDFTRFGIDFQADVEDFRIQGIFVAASDDTPGGGDDDNNAYTVQAMYVNADGDRPRFVPVVRWDHREINDGSDDFDDLIVNFTYYIRQNIKVYAEYANRFNAPTSADETERFTIQLIAAF